MQINKSLTTLLVPLVLMATFYDDWYIGRLTASGVPFSQERYFGASNQYPLGSKVKVKYKGKVIKVKIVDRCDCSLDLSKRAFKDLASLVKGKINVSVVKEY